MIFGYLYLVVKILVSSNSNLALVYIYAFYIFFTRLAKKLMSENVRWILGNCCFSTALTARSGFPVAKSLKEKKMDTSQIFAQGTKNGC